MKVAELPDLPVQNPNMVMQHIQVMLQAMLLSDSDELVRAYTAVRTIFNGSPAAAADATGTP